MAFMGFLVGVLLRFSTLIDPIHELCHYFWAQAEGIKVIALHWSSIVYARESLMVLYGGYMSEFFLYAVLFYLFFKRRFLNGMILGILTVVWVVSFFSLDFNQNAARTLTPEGIMRMKVMWGIVSTPVWILIIRAIRRAYVISSKSEE